MRKLSPHERSLVGSIEGAIKLSRTGMSPNSAISKIAQEEGRGPEYVRRMVEGYNKSKSVDYLSKTAAEARANRFDLADFDVIMADRYKEPMAKQASDFFLPTDDFSLMDVGDNLQEKVASVFTPTEKKEHPHTTYGKLVKHAHLVEGLRQQLHNKTQTNKYNMDRALDKVASIMAPYSDKQLRKVAQKVVNGYPDNGDAFVRLIGRKINRDMSGVQKTANATIFPTEEPYLSISSVFDFAEKMARAEVEEKVFEKTSGLLDSIQGSTVASIMREGVDLHRNTGDDSFKAKKTDELDPQTFNELKSIDARRHFMNLALYDDDLKNYDIQDLETAYNDTVSTIPQAYENPVVLRNTMLRNLQGAGKEPFELKTELEIQDYLMGGGTNTRRKKKEEEKDK